MRAYRTLPLVGGSRLYTALIPGVGVRSDYRTEGAQINFAEMKTLREIKGSWHVHRVLELRGVKINYRLFDFMSKAACEAARARNSVQGGKNVHSARM